MKQENEPTHGQQANGTRTLPAVATPEAQLKVQEAPVGPATTLHLAISQTKSQETARDCAVDRNNYLRVCCWPGFGIFHSISHQVESDSRFPHWRISLWKILSEKIALRLGPKHWGDLRLTSSVAWRQRGTMIPLARENVDRLLLVTCPGGGHWIAGK